MINLRSPYFVTFNQTNLTSVAIELYAYTGTKSTDRGTVKYTLNADAIDETIVVDIAELARDYITSTFDGTYASTAIWVEYRINEYISSVPAGYGSYFAFEAFDGYNYHEDGSFYHDDDGTDVDYTAPDVLQSNTVIYKSDDGLLRVPVLQNNNPVVTFMYKGIVTNTETITSDTESTNIIRYVTHTGQTYNDFKARVEADSGTYEEEAIQRLYNSYSTNLCDTVIVNAGGTITKLTVKNVCEGKYDPVKLTFINRYGALQDIWFFKKSSLSLGIQSNKYKVNVLSGLTYDTTEPVYRKRNSNGRESLTLNTGLYEEEYNEVFRQLMLSDKVWITYEGDVLPVMITGSDLQYKTSVNDKMVNYTITVEFAFDKVSNVR